MGIFRTKRHFRTWFKVVVFYAAAVLCALGVWAGLEAILYLTAPGGEIRFESASLGSPTVIGIFWAMAVILFGVTIFLRRFLDGARPLISLGLDFRRAAVPALWGCLTGVLVNAAAYLLIIVCGGAKPTFVGSALAAPGGFALAVVLLVGAAAMEELGFRGYPVKVIDEQWSRLAAVLLTSVLFAACHGANPAANTVGVANIFLAGVVLALLYLKSGSLWTAIGFHFGWNFVEGPLLGSAVSGFGDFPTLITSAASGPGLISGGAFGVEGSVMTTAVEAAVIVLLIFDKFPLIRLSGERPAGVGEDVLSSESVL